MAGPPLRGDVEDDECDLRVGPASPLRRRTARGPFKTFHHEHVFRPLADGTELHDRVAFEAPLGPLGRIAEVALLGRYLPRLIDVRNQFLVEEAQHVAAGTRPAPMITPVPGRPDDG